MGSFEDFIEAMNVGLVRESGGEWDGNLDAFDDYLCWPGANDYELEFLGSETCRTHLGHAAMARKLSQTLQTCHPENRANLGAQIERARRGEGPTLFDLLRENVESKAHVHLVLS